jgi:peptidoglycan hydrolase CwlO-like protein
MQLINQALKEKNFKLADLSEELKEKINDHKEMIVKFNMAIDEYENDEDEDAATEKKLDEQEDFIANNEKELADEVKNYVKPEPEPEPRFIERRPEHRRPEPAKEKKSDVGWLIFGGVVLAITLGAVNVFKKK